VGLGAQATTGPSSARPTPAEYHGLIQRLRAAVRSVAPPGARVAVVSRGDEELLRLDGRSGWHFPQAEGGGYAGHYPADGEAAIAEVERIRQDGAQYLVFPATALWWLDYYEGLRQHLESGHGLVHEEPDTCLIFALVEHSAPVADQIDVSRRTGSQFAGQFRDLLRSLLPRGAVVAVVDLGDRDLLSLDGQHGRSFQPGAAAPRTDLARLEAMPAEGVDYLAIPRPAFEWAEHHPELVDHLRSRHRLVTRQAHVCEVYELRQDPAGKGASPADRRVLPSDRPRRRFGWIRRLFGRRKERGGDG
jgi:hypothetical protein